MSNIMIDIMIDSHVHLNRAEFDGQAAAVIKRAAQAGVGGFLNVGYDLETSRQSIALAESDPRVLATVGIHPHDALLVADETGAITAAGASALEEIESLAAHPRVVAIGEIGLDFYRDLSPRPAQHAALVAQLELAERVGLPVVFHIRDAWPETLAVIDEVGVPTRKGVLHSFTGDAESVVWAAERGMLLGIGGPVTYKNSRLPELLTDVDPSLLLLETDAPWLPPVPHRGQRNEPAYLQHTRDRLAAVLGLSPDEVARATTANFRRVFAGDLL
jgi:TatD DNase family protein